VDDKSTLNRRNALACLCAVPMLAVWPQAKIEASEKHPGSIYDQAFLTRLLDVLDTQAEMNNGSPSTSQGREAAREAFERLAPRSHLEAAIIAVFAEKARHKEDNWRDQPQQPDIIGEYVNRRSGAKAQMPDHPALSCPGLGMPYTYGLLMFREQVTGLVQILTGVSQKRAETIRWQLISDLTLKKDFFESIFFGEMSKNYGQLTLAELEAILWNIEAYRTLFAPSYVWASTMVSRAE
jgi:hypothetical protein